MWDVARAAGVSQATVSLALNSARGSRVSDTTRKRILRAARELGYRTNATAKALREGAVGIVGFIGDQVASSPFAGAIIEGAQQRAWEDGLLLMVVNTSGDAGLEEAAAEQMLTHQVQRFVYASMYNRPIEVPEALGDRDVVVLNAVNPSGRHSSVSPDEVSGGRAATEHLLARGHRRVAMIDIQTLDSGLPAAVGRHEGYQAAMKDAGLVVDPAIVRFGGGGPQDGYEHARALFAGRDLADPATPTAVFCANDRTAWGAYQALAELGLRVPDDVSIVGFDNQEELAPFLRPGLTTMDLPLREMGHLAVDILLDGAVQGAAVSAPAAEARLVPCELVERGSVSSPRRTA
jgi:LacI family transcriptional regulator